MNEYIRIQNFGPIIDVELENISRLTIFTGENGSGQSLIMKIVYFLKWAYSHSFLFPNMSDIFYKKYKPYINDNTKITYKRDGKSIEYKNERFIIDENIPKDLINKETSCFISNKRYMIPYFLTNQEIKDKLNYEIANLIDTFTMACKGISEFNIDCLGIKFKADKVKDGIGYTINDINGNNYTINFKDASSGIQSALSLCLIIEYYLTEIGASRKIDFFVEEPELNIYPDSQIKVIDFMIDKCFMSSGNNENNLMMCTNSPYILNYINLLMRRGKDSGKTFIIPEYVNVYEVSDGHAESLKILADNKPLIDTRLMSDPISKIYKEFKEY